jgi:hypothetical protein
MFSGIKLFGLLAIGVIIAGAIGYHFVEMNLLNGQLNTERQNNATLATDNGKLQTANSSLNTALKAQQDQTAQIIAEMKNLTAAQDRAAQALSNTETFLTKATTVQKINSLRSNPQTSGQLLSLINRDSTCIWQHLYESGKCVNGNWQPTVATH